MIPNRQKREFVAGYIEGQNEKKNISSKPSVSSAQLGDALKKLGTGRESAAAPWLQIYGAEAKKLDAILRPKRLLKRTSQQDQNNLRKAA